MLVRNNQRLEILLFEDFFFCVFFFFIALRYLIYLYIMSENGEKV